MPVAEGTHDGLLWYAFMSEDVEDLFTAITSFSET